MIVGLLLTFPFLLPTLNFNFLANSRTHYWQTLDLRYLMMAFPIATAFAILRYQTFRSSPPLFLAAPLLMISALAAEALAALWRWWQPLPLPTIPVPIFMPTFVLFLAVSSFWATQSVWKGFLGRLLHKGRRNTHDVWRFGQQLIGQTELSKLASMLADVLVTEMELEQAAVWLWDENEQTFRLVSTAGVWNNALPHTLVAPKATNSSTSLFHLRETQPPCPEWLRPLQTFSRAEIAAPLVANERYVGLLLLGRRWDTDIIDEQEMEVIQLAAQQATLFLLTTQQIASLQLVPQQVAAAQEEERLRIAQELHDTIQQFLGRLPFALEVGRGWLYDDPQEADQILQRCVDDVEEAARTVRQISSHLAPTQLQNGLKAPLANLVSQFQRRTHIPVTCVVPSELDLAASPARRHALYRIVQQALDNIASHAPQATVVEVSLTCTNGNLTFEIADNGPGSSPTERLQAQMQGHFGLQSMMARTQGVGGTLHFESVPGQGTRISGYVPIEIKI
jgi:signal transduction histidine kinase